MMVNVSPVPYYKLYSTETSAELSTNSPPVRAEFGDSRVVCAHGVRPEDVSYRKRPDR